MVKIKWQWKLKKISGKYITEETIAKQTSEDNINQLIK